MSTSVSYLRKRLADIGRHDLLDAAEAGLVSFFAAAEEAGLIRRKEVQGNGSPNQAKKRAWALHKISKQTATPPEAEFSHQPVQPKFSQGTRNGRLAPPDLGAILAEWEEAQRSCDRDRDRELELDRELVHEREPAAAVLPEPVHFPLNPAVPCTSCNRPEAAAALREVVNVYVAVRRGEPTEAGNVLPRTCCQRQLRGRPDIKAMIA